ncbi:hypothetical protein DOTSEDRAFT_75317 [Dothistroma septosporum NZE10]|uniref:Uncharacterized protein n=1 Tax=Dothistroma septosporum (strain NZE10 / CBS 128990) TaxID=675120 RepID=M2YKY4_DOTSN|nr:hypothetical protein DOTSEDRAFT_75317 [Dothistroma septosporum NZE10]
MPESSSGFSSQFDEQVLISTQCIIVTSYALLAMAGARRLFLNLLRNVLLRAPSMQYRRVLPWSGLGIRVRRMRSASSRPALRRCGPVRLINSHRIDAYQSARGSLCDHIVDTASPGHLSTSTSMHHHCTISSPIPHSFLAPDNLPTSP